jgi:hypothetical protein
MSGLKVVCPQHHQYSVGAYAADSVVRLLDESVADWLAPFHSQHLKRLVRIRRGFTLNISGLADEEARFAGAVLAKIAQRGFPTPCSLELERFLLKQAEKVGWLRWKEQQEAGTFLFSIIKAKNDLPLYLRVCFFAELLVSDDEADTLLDCYRSLCTTPEQEFFERSLL